MLCLCVWRISLRALSREPAFGSLERELSKYEQTLCRERGIISERMPWRNKSVCLLFYSLHFILSSSIFWGTEARLTIVLCLILHTWVTCSCDFNFTEFGQRQGNLIQLLAKTSSSMCILWTFQNFSEDLCQDVPRAKWRQGDIPNKWHLSGWGRTWGVMLAMNNGFLMKMSIYTRLECLARCQYLLFAGAGTIFVRISGLRI